jgi:hypothetical protein
MASTIPTAFVQQYKSNIMVLAQQKGSRLRNTVMTEDINAEKAYFERLASTEMIAVTSRYQPTPLIEPEHSRRAYTISDWAWGTLLDRFDKIRYIIDPKSDYVRIASYAAGRTMDDTIIEAATADSREGKNGASVVPFPASQKVNEGSSAALDIDALRDVKYRFDAQDIDPDEPKYLLVGARQLQDLLEQEEITSSDFSTIRALVDGKVNSFMGFNFILTNRLPVYNYGAPPGTNERRCLAYTREAMRLGLGDDMKVEIDKRPDIMNNWQLLVTMTIGAVRTEDVQVVEVYAVEP